MEDIRISIGKQIAEMRKEAGLTQVQLAEKSGVGFSHIGRIELGKYSIGIDTLQKIADVFGKRIDFVGNDSYFKALIEKSNEPKPVLIHITGVKGLFVKKYTPTGHVENIMIDCGDGLKFHAPANEFHILVPQNHHKNQE